MAQQFVPGKCVAVADIDAVTDRPSAAAKLAEILSGDANDYEDKLDAASPGTTVVLGSPGSGEERTVVATSNPADKGVYNNWRPASEMRPLLQERMRGASAGKTMYVVPYLMAPPGSPLASSSTSCLGSVRVLRNRILVILPLTFILLKL